MATTNKERCAPAVLIIRKLKGAARIARELKINIPTVCAWALPSAGKGSIPTWHWKGLQQLALQDGWELKNEHFLGELPLDN